MRGLWAMGWMALKSLRMSRAWKVCVHEVRSVYKKAVITQRDSRGVPHRSTNRALRRLTSEFRWDPVHSTQYERRQTEDSSKNTQPHTSSQYSIPTNHFHTTTNLFPPPATQQNSCNPPPNGILSPFHSHTSPSLGLYYPPN